MMIHSELLFVDAKHVYFCYRFYLRLHTVRLRFSLLLSELCICEFDDDDDDDDVAYYSLSCGLGLFCEEEWWIERPTMHDK